MIALDTNFIIHFLVKSQKEHLRASQWIFRNESPLCTTDVNLAEVLRLLTHPRVFPSPLGIEEAVDLLHQFCGEFEIKILEEPEQWWLELKELFKLNPTLKGNEVFDAQIAICLRYHGVKELVTLDTDFSKYPFLKIIKI